MNWFSISYGFFIPADESEKGVAQRALLHFLDLTRQEIKNKRTEMRRDRHIKRILANLKKTRHQPAGFHLDEGRILLFQEALASYQDLCEREIANGGSAPFVADLPIIKRIRAASHEEFVGTLAASLPLAALLTNRMRGGSGQ